MVVFALQTNQAPDLFNGAALQTCVENGQLIAYEDINGGDEYVKQFDGYLVEGNHTIKGKTYAAPKAVTLCGLVYNKDLFKEAGIVDENGEALPPETWDDVREVRQHLPLKATMKATMWAVWQPEMITVLRNHALC